jgi:restriction endonuclease S subunit
LVVNRYKIQKEINKNINYESFIDLVEYLPKSKKQASEWKEIWKYPFFTSSEIQSKWVDEFDYEKECLIIWDWWKASINISKEFSANSHNYIIQAIPWKIINKYLYFLLKYNLDILEAWFKWAWIKNISKEYLNNIQIPISSIEYQEEIVKQIEWYEKIINWAKQVIETCKPEIEIKEEWDFVEIWEVCEIITDWTHQTPNYTDSWIIFLSSKDVISQKIDWQNTKFVSLEDHNKYIKSVKPQVDDVLLSKNWVNSWISALVDKDIDFSIYVSIALLRPIKNLITPKYLSKIINTENTLNKFKWRFKWIWVPNLHLWEIKEVKIPLPSLEEQEKIVEELEKEQTLVNANKELIKIFEDKIKNIVQKIWNWE